MNKKLRGLYRKYLNVESKIRDELDRFEVDECNCDDQEEINIIAYEGDEIRVDRRCGNCGGVIWNRELL